MCGRYQLDFSDSAPFKNRFDIDGELPEFQRSYNIAPSQVEPVVLSNSPNRVELMLWGLVPFWEEKKEKPHGLINLRDDTILQKAWAKRYLTEKRCLVPATGFYEWKRTEDGKIPYSFRLKSRDYFSFAGLYTTYKHPKSGEEIQCYAIITTSPNELMSKVHNRMPVILQKEEESEWLSHDMVELEHIAKYLKPYPALEMEAYPVSTRVNRPENDSLLIQPQKEDPKDSNVDTPNSK